MHMEGELRISKGRVFQTVGAAIQQSYENWNMYGHEAQTANWSLRSADSKLR